MGAPKLQTPAEMRAEIAALPAGMHGEVLGPGDWRAMGRPGVDHRSAAKWLVRGLSPDDRDGGGGWWIDVEPEVELGERLFVPDLAGWRIEGGDLAFLDENPVKRAPDWVCEILSRSTQRADRALKLPVYAAAGVGHVWVVDPAARSIEVYAVQNGLAALVAAVTAGKSAVLPPFSLDVDVEALFRRG